MYRALKVRKELAELAVQAVWLELETAGGAGYLSESDTARRLREAAFFPCKARAWSSCGRSSRSMRRRTRESERAIGRR